MFENAITVIIINMHKQSFSIEGCFWINKGDEEFLAVDKLKLLKAIMEEGSINAAAKKTGLSYQQAWNTIEKLNRLAPLPVLIVKRGGRQGGGVQITGYGRRIIHEIIQIETEFAKDLEALNRKINLCF